MGRLADYLIEGGQQGAPACCAGEQHASVRFCSASQRSLGLQLAGRGERVTRTSVCVVSPQDRAADYQPPHDLSRIVTRMGRNRGGGFGGRKAIEPDGEARTA